MKAWLQERRFENSPIRVWMIVILIISVIEAVVMFVLPVLLPPAPSLLLSAVVDSVLLTVMIAPLLWWFIERPLQATNALRAEFLAEYFARTEAERRHIACDLHDGVGQSLTLLVSGLKSAESLKLQPECQRHLHELQEIAFSALRDVKRLALGLRPSLLDDLGLGPALENIVAETRERHSVDIDLSISGLTEDRLTENVETAIFRITQESLTNIVKHSQARNAWIKIRYCDGTVDLEVRDNGKGIPDHFLRGGNGRHLGLTGIRERATLLGGQVAIDSIPGVGTTISVRIPATLCAK